MGYNYGDPPAEEFHKKNPKIPMMGTENVSAVGTRGHYVTDRTKGIGRFVRPVHHHGPRFRRGLVAIRQRAAVGGGRLHLDRFRLPRGTVALPVAQHQLAVRRDRYLRIPQGHVLLLSVLVDATSRCCTYFRTGTGPGLEGQEIAVWVHSNLDKVELFLNGQSLGAKEMLKDQHLAWNVKYAPGTIEARGYKDGRQVMTAKRETTGPAAKLLLRADRREVAADGADVAILAVEVQDAEGRVVPVTENEVTFKVTGPGEVIGTGNGDPTNHEPDPAPARKAFGGLCVAIVQSGKTAGSLRVEATSPGLTPAAVTIASKAVKLRPQVAVWEREVPTGPGVTGLWRPAASIAAAATGDPMALMGANVDMVFTLRQDGSAITGEVEAAGGGGFMGGGSGGAIENGRMDGANISFRAGGTTYTGTIDGDRIELRRSAPAGLRGLPGGQPPPARDGTAPGDRSASGRLRPVVWSGPRWPWRSGARAAGVAAGHPLDPRTTNESQHKIASTEWLIEGLSLEPPARRHWPWGAGWLRAVPTRSASKSTCAGRPGRSRITGRNARVPTGPRLPSARSGNRILCARVN